MLEESETVAAFAPGEEATTKFPRQRERIKGATPNL
jgi:hypothetical protein